jgi:hypothetical protein
LLGSISAKTDELDGVHADLCAAWQNIIHVSRRRGDYELSDGVNQRLQKRLNIGRRHSFEDLLFLACEGQLTAGEYVFVQ